MKLIKINVFLLQHVNKLLIDSHRKFLAIFIILNFIFSLTLIFHETDLRINENNPNLISSVLQATAGIVGIVFAISILVVQHAATNYSPTILSSFKKDEQVWFSLAYGLFTIVFMSFTMIFSWQLIILNMFFFICTLGLLAVYFFATFDKINPISIISKIRKSMILELNLISPKLKNIAIQQHQNDTTDMYKLLLKDVPDIVHYAILSKGTPDLLSKVKTLENTLRQIILDAVKKGEYQTSREGLNIYPALITDYLKLIPNYSWHNDKFLEEILQNMDVLSSKAIKDEDIIFIKDLIDCLKNSGIAFIETIPRIGGTFETNQPASLCLFYLKKIGKKAIEIPLYDTTASAIQSIGDMGVLLSVKYNNDHIASANTMELANVAITQKDFFIPSIAAQKSFQIVQALTYGLTNSSHVKPRIEDLSKFLQAFMASKINDMQLMDLFTDIAYHGAIPCVKTAILIKNGKFEMMETRSREKNSKEIVSSLISLVGNTGLVAMQNGRISFALACADCLFSISVLCIPEKFKLFKQHFQDELKQIISYLMGLNFFARTLKSPFDTDITRSIVDIALLSMLNELPDIVTLIIDKIYDSSIKIFDTDQYGYDSIRNFYKLDFLACYAVSTSNSILLEKIAKTYLEFNKQYELKYGREPSDPASDRFSFDSYEEWQTNNKTLQELLKNTINSQNGLLFEKKILELKILELKDHLKTLKKK